MTEKWINNLFTFGISWAAFRFRWHWVESGSQKANWLQFISFCWGPFSCIVTLERTISTVVSTDGYGLADGDRVINKWLMDARWLTETESRCRRTVEVVVQCYGGGLCVRFGCRVSLASLSLRFPRHALYSTESMRLCFPKLYDSILMFHVVWQLLIQVGRDGRWRSAIRTEN